MKMDEVTNEFLAQQMRRLLTEFAEMRDEQRVQGAMLNRVDRTLSAFLEEFRETHTQIRRMNDRIRQLEDEKS
jgi:hypothetical protein